MNKERSDAVNPKASDALSERSERVGTKPGVVGSNPTAPAKNYSGSKLNFSSAFLVRMYLRKP